MREEIKIRRQVFRKGFGDRIKSLREYYGISLKEMSFYIGVCKSTLERWESGKSSPKITHLVKFSSRFKVSINYLMGLDNK